MKPGTKDGGAEAVVITCIYTEQLYCTDKKGKKNFLVLRKFRRDRVQSHI
jgi:hypothetical protein